jgi:predicted transposase YbfD/YdcC
MRGTSAIFHHFENLTDPRIDRTKHHLLYDMVVIAMCASICGADGWADVERFGKSKQKWFEQFLRLENGIPSHDTFGRVFSLLDPQEFLTCLHNWLRGLRLTLKDRGIAIDGKTIRRSFDNAQDKSALHIVSAWASGLRISLGHVAVEDKSNEITAVPKLLELLELTGAVVTLDAMHCQKDTATAIRSRGADYILTVKANQPTLFAYLQDQFLVAGEEDYKGSGVHVHTITERNRTRVERREHYVMKAPKELIDQGKWKDLRSVVMVYRYREENGVISEETMFYISSLPPRVRRLAKLIRGHWGIENSLHWVLDVTFNEDQCRIRKGHGPEIASMFRRLAINILEQDTTLKSSIRGKRLLAGWNNDVLEAILSDSNGN